MAGRPLNIASPKQLQELLFGELKLPVVKRTAKTGPSTDADVLGAACPVASAAGQDPRIPAIRQAQEHVRRCLAAKWSAPRRAECMPRSIRSWRPPAG